MACATVARPAGALFKRIAAILMLAGFALAADTILAQQIPPGYADPAPAMTPFPAANPMNTGRGGGARRGAAATSGTQPLGRGEGTSATLGRGRGRGRRGAGANGATSQTQAGARRGGGNRGAAPAGIGGSNAAPTHAMALRGNNDEPRANNDLLYYHLDIRVDPARQYLSGKNTIRFKMLKDGNKIQIDLNPELKVDKILLGKTELKYTRDDNATFIDFPKTLKKGETCDIEFYYSGSRTPTGRFGGITFKKTPGGKDWVTTACEDEGSSAFWPGKDQWRDEVESMDISIACPNGLMDVSNGKFVGSKDLGDGYTQWNWHVSYPINSYAVSINIANYVHFDDKYKNTPMDFYAIPEDLEKAKINFPQAKGMLEAYDYWFGEYPFAKDGYKLVEVNYSGMEHQSAVTYGNGFANGYGARDWTGVGISPLFDFIIIHESGHEYFANSVTAADRSDMWIHEGITTYLEGLYVEYYWGKDNGIKYLNGYKGKIANRAPIVGERGLARSPGQDQYFKGALFLNTLRSSLGVDNKQWRDLLHDFYQHFKYQNIMTEDVVAWWNKATGKNLTPIFNEYLRHAALPVLELKFDKAKGTVDYRWQAEEKGFAMPIEIGKEGDWKKVTPTSEWKTMKTTIGADDFGVPDQLYYVNIKKS